MMDELQSEQFTVAVALVHSCGRARGVMPIGLTKSDNAQPTCNSYFNAVVNTHLCTFFDTAF